MLKSRFENNFAAKMKAVNGCVSSSSSDILKDRTSLNHNGFDVQSEIKHPSFNSLTKVDVQNSEEMKSLLEAATELTNLANSTSCSFPENVNSCPSRSTTNLQNADTASMGITTTKPFTSTSPKQINLTRSVDNGTSSNVSSSSIHVVFPSDSSVLSPPPSSQSQGTVVTAFLTPVQNAPTKKSGASAISPTTYNSPRNRSQPSVVHATTLSGAKILVAQSSTVVNGQLRQNVVPSTTAGTTILLTQGCSMLTMPTKTVTTSNVNFNSLGTRKFVTSTGATLTIPYTQANIVRTTLPVNTSVNLPTSISTTSGQPSLPIAFSITPNKTVSTSTQSLSSVSPLSSAKPHSVSPNNIRSSVNTKLKSSHSSNNPSSYSYSSTHRYCGLPYQDHNYGAPPPPTPPQSPIPPDVSMPGHETSEFSLISVDEDTNTSIASSVSTDTALSNNGEDIEVTVNSSVPELNPFKILSGDGDQSITRCICEFNHDDEYMICCDKCLVWQHVDCMGLNRSDIPDTYLCERCLPRKIDIKRAKSLQSRKRGKLRPVKDNSETSSADESKDENSQKQVLLKSKKLKRKSDQKVERFNLKKRRKQKKNRSTSLNGIEEDSRDGYENGMFREWIDKYEEALINQYTPEIQVLVSSLQINGKNELLVKRASKQLRAQLCKVVWNASSGRRLVSTSEIEANSSIIEYRGKFLSLSQFKDQNPFFSNKMYPFVLFYSPGVGREDVCVDAREYGNTARFVRRSCTPNAEVRHVVENGLLHLYLFTLRKIAKDEEMTISFDFNYRKCVNKVECACSKEKCPVATVIIKKNIVNHLPIVEKEKKRTLRRKSECLIEEVHERQANKPRTPMSPVKTPKKPSTPVKLTSPPVITSSESQSKPEDLNEMIEAETSEQLADKKHKMTREERKLEAIMKAIERMEKTEKRKLQALERNSSKGNADGDQPSSSESKDFSCEDAAPPPEKLDPIGVTEEQAVVDDVSHEEPSKPQQKPKKCKKRKASGTPTKRRPRTVSGSSEHSLALSSADESGYITSIGTISTPNTSFPIDPEFLKMSPGGTNCPFRFPKTKKSMMSEWLHEKPDNSILLPPTSPLSLKCDGSANYPQFPLTVSDYFNSGCQTSYVRNTRGGSTGINIAHLRRGLSNEKPNMESNLGSAKKRWLRQVLHEEETVQENPNPSGSPVHSPCASPPTDSITPLKKRRLMRESMSFDMPAPSSPCVASCSNPSFESTNDIFDSKTSDDCEGNTGEAHCDSTNSNDDITAEKKTIPVKSEEVYAPEPIPDIKDSPVEENNDCCVETPIKIEDDTSVNVDLKKVEKKQELDVENDSSSEDKVIVKTEIESCVVDDSTTVREEGQEMTNPTIDEDVVKQESPKLAEVKKEEIEQDIVENDQDNVEVETKVEEEIKAETKQEQEPEENDVISADENPCIKTETCTSNAENLKVDDQKPELVMNECSEDSVEIAKEEELDAFASEEKANLQCLNVMDVEASPPQIASVKKKVSLSEYRMRKNLTKPSPSVSPSHSKASTPINDTTTTPDSDSTSPINFPPLPPLPASLDQSSKLTPLPLFKSFNDEKKPKSIKPKLLVKEKNNGNQIKNMKREERRKIEDEDAHNWDSAPTSSEKVAEQQRENLTQRLKREFGLLSDQESQASSGETSSDERDRNSIPPPPPKPVGGHFHVEAYESDLPPPPPPPPRRTISSITSSTHPYAMYTSNTVAFSAQPAAIAMYPPAASAFVQTQPITNFAMPTAPPQHSFVPTTHPQYQQPPPSQQPAVLVYPTIQMQPTYAGQSNTLNLPSNYTYSKDH